MMAGLLAAMAVSGIIVFLITWAFSYSARYTPLLLTRAAEHSVNFATDVARLGGEKSLREWLINQQPGPGPSQSIVYAVERDGTEISGRTPPAAALSRAMAETRARPDTPALRWISLDGRDVLLFTAHTPANFFTASVRFFSGGPHVPLWILSLSLLLVVSLAAAGLAWRISRPVRKLEAAMAAAAGGDLSVRVADDMRGSGLEFERLAARFDKLASTIQVLIGRQRRLFHNVSHEIRSPLARINCAVDLARRSPDSSARMLDLIEADVKKLDSLVGDILTYARLEENAGLQVSDVDLCGLAADIASLASLEASARRITVESRTPPQDIVIRGDGALLAHAVENVVRNALRFSPDGGLITVSVSPAEAGVVSVTVEDEGPGLDENEFGRAFEPFARGTGEATGTGYGLGLAIAHEAVTAHGGSISLENRKPHGLRVRFDLPASRN